jgi:hypothetical protein
MGRLRLAILFVTCSVGPAFAVDCKVPHFNFVPSDVTEVTMYVAPDAACSFQMASLRGDRGVFGILSSKVVTKPKNGIVGKSSVRRYAYKPNPGYFGSDEFDVDVVYDRDGANETTTLHVSVYIGGGI